MGHRVFLEGICSLEVEGDRTYWEALRSSDAFDRIVEMEEAVALHAGGEVIPLKAVVNRDGAVRLIRRSSVLGQRIAERTSLFLVGLAAYRLFGPRPLKVKYSYGPGVFCSFDEPLREEEAEQLEEEANRLTSAHLEIEYKQLDSLAGLENAFVRGRASLDRYGVKACDVYQVGDYAEVSWLPMLPNTGLVRGISIVNYPPGFVVVPADREFREIPKLFQAFFEYDRWLSVLGIETVSDINRMARTGEIVELIKAAEALHEKKISYIADEIAERRVRLVLAAGPSSSGKTTFSRRLAVQLRVNGLKPINMGTDDYFVSRDRTPRDEKGNYDYDAFEALDLEALSRDLRLLMAGEEIELCKYDFVKGTRIPTGKRVRLPEDGVLILEGIHALNPKTTEAIPAHQKYKVYVSALAHLNLDEVNRTFTTDARLVRRLVRDNFYRAYPAQETLRQWPIVRRGEDRGIFPFQQEADAFFNSALPYELLVLKPFVEPLLMQVPDTAWEFTDAWRLKQLLRYFESVTSAFVPSTSILREFIGGSAFDVY
ncbi:nucleoside kinase [Coprothermobacteraceae bacterium]|nr:nucleoside kinase [Coprothermobacteraceae bacterium]